MNPLSELRKRIFTRNGKVRFGALSRVSEELEVSRQTIRNWYAPTVHGIRWKPGKVTLARIESILGDENFTFLPKKPGPKGPRKKVFSSVKA